MVLVMVVWVVYTMVMVVEMVRLRKLGTIMEGVEGMVVRGVEIREEVNGYWCPKKNPAQRALKWSLFEIY